jgi:hypothetical protein
MRWYTDVIMNNVISSWGRVEGGGGVGVGLSVHFSPVLFPLMTQLTVLR